MRKKRKRKSNVTKEKSQRETTKKRRKIKNITRIEMVKEDVEKRQLNQIKKTFVDYKRVKSIQENIQNFENPTISLPLSLSIVFSEMFDKNKYFIQKDVDESKIDIIDNIDNIDNIIENSDQDLSDSDLSSSSSDINPKRRKRKSKNKKILKNQKRGEKRRNKKNTITNKKTQTLKDKEIIDELKKNMYPFFIQ